MLLHVTAAAVAGDAATMPHRVALHDSSKGQQIQMIVGPYKVVVREDARIEVKAKFKGEHVANKVLSQVKDCLLRSGERIIDTFDVVAGNVVASAELGRNVKIRALLRDRRDGTKLEDDNNGKAVLVIGETPPVAAAAAAVAAAASAAAAVAAAAAAAGGGGAAATDGAGETKEEAFQQKVVVSNNGTVYSSSGWRSFPSLSSFDFSFLFFFPASFLGDLLLPPSPFKHN